MEEVPKKSRRWPKVVLGLFVLLVLLVALAPMLLAPIVKSRIEQELATRSNARASIESLEFSWAGVVKLEGLLVENDAGPILTCVRIEADADVLAALTGTYRATTTVESFALIARQDSDGTWDVAKWFKEEDEDSESGDDEEPTLIPALPELDLTVTGRVELIGTEGTAKIEDLLLTTKTLGERASANLECKLVGLKGEEGQLLAEVTGTIRDGGLDQVDLSSRVDAPFLNGVLAARCQQVGRLMTPADDGPAELESCTADLTYRPAEISVLLGPLLPVELAPRSSGQAEEKIDCSFNGTFTGMDMEDLLAGARGTANVGLGRVTTEMLDVEGDLNLVLGEGNADWKATLTANGGALLVSGALDPKTWNTDGNKEKPATVIVDAKGVGATSRLAPLLSLLHPAFGAVDTLDQSKLEGVIDCDLELSYDGPLKTEVLSGGMETIPSEAITGRGRFAMVGARLAGAPLLNHMLKYLGARPGASTQLQPIGFTITRGRIVYDEDWKWSIGDVESSFIGSVGLDSSLDLSWNVPVTDTVVKEYSMLSGLLGTGVRLPITGTVTSPVLNWKAAMGDLTTGLVKGELLKELGLGDVALEDLTDPEKLGDLLDQLGSGGSIGSKDKGAADPEAGPARTPKELLDLADRLWSEDKRTEAAALYREIRENHKVSLIYALHRDKIKKRGDHAPE